MFCSFGVKAHIKILKVWRIDEFEVSIRYFELDLVVDLFITCQSLSSNLLDNLEYSLGNF